MKIAIFYHHVLKASQQTGKPIAEILRILKAEGLSGMEINAPDADETLLETLEQTGVSVSSLYRVVPVFNGETEKGLQLVDRAKEIGCRTVMILPGGYPEGMDKETAQKKSIKPLVEISEYGKKNGIYVTVEDYDGARTLFGTSSDMCYFESFAPHLFYTYDSGNFYTVEAPLEAFEALKTKIRHVHLKDYAHNPIAGCTKSRVVRSGHMLYDVPFGYGALPGAEILRRLKELKYEGFLCLEHTDAEKMMDANLAAIRWVRKHI